MRGGITFYATTPTGRLFCETIRIRILLHVSAARSLPCYYCCCELHRVNLEANLPAPQRIDECGIGVPCCYCCSCSCYCFWGNKQLNIVLFGFVPVELFIVRKFLIICDLYVLAFVSPFAKRSVVNTKAGNKRNAAVQ